ncbi:DUF1642 domain-containing protein [Lactococcus lactis]|uniref:DUF1642 domain-containing protein n=1 Tax=Lactococcus lactis TaxID=1358 RepID=UPI001259F6E6|nr:DUF1642 domain-containing protein [Lactococcus lactis]TYR29149.1 DUF1642 domain-containing protein [Lactococcus lactis subsp. lactis bv. diacetylactis]
MTKFEEELSSLPVSKSTNYAKYWNKAELLKVFKDWQPQQPQQALPVVPEFIGKLINTFGAPEDGKYINYSASYLEIQKELDWIDNHQKTWLTALLIGFTVEKPQLFYIDLPKVFGLSDSTSDSTFVSKAESGIISEFTKGKDYALKLTEQEIKSIDERYWQFAVPVEDGE